MNVLVLNGIAKENSGLDAVSCAICSTFQSADCPTSVFRLRDHHIAPCVGCYSCWTKTPGMCVIDDDARDIAGRFISSDLVVFLCEITYGGYSYELKKALDRMIPLISPLFHKVNREVHHQPRYDKYPSILAVGILVEPDQLDVEIFHRLAGRNAVNFDCPSYASVVLDAHSAATAVTSEVHSFLKKAGGIS